MRTDESTMPGQRGVTLAVTEWSPDTDSAVSADLVLIHGLGEHSGRYRPVAETLCAAGVRVTTADLRGHGRSTGVRRGHVDDFALLVDDVAALVERARTAGRPLFLFGHSMGGLAALRCAQRRDDGLAGLIIAGIALVPAESVPPMLVKVVNGLGRAAPNLGTIRLEGDAISRDPEVRADYDRDPLNYRGRISAGTARQLNLAMTAAVADADRVSCPVLILHGGADRLTSPEGSEMLASAVASEDVTLRIWPGAYHELHHEPERDEVLATIVEWITKRS